MAVSKQQGTVLMSDSFIRTRRLNQTQGFLLEERLKVLDCKKTQKNAEFNEEKQTLWKEMEEIKTVRKNVGISVERRKLLRSQGFTVDARAAQRQCEGAVAIRKYSMPEATRVDSPRPQRSSSLSSCEGMMNGLSQLHFQDSGGKGNEIASSEPSKDLKDQTERVGRSRARHQFRVIEPPCRPGSRRNFVQISNDKLRKLKEKEDEKSGETLFDPGLKLDHRGVIVSSRLPKSSRNNSLSEADEGEPDKLIMQPSESCEGSISEQQIYQDKQTKDSAYNSRPTSVELIQVHSEQTHAKSGYLEDKLLSVEESRKLRSKSCESLDRMTEVHALDSSQDRHLSVSRYLIRSGSPRADQRSTDGKFTRTAHSALELGRKHATCENKFRTQLAFTDPENDTSSLDDYALNKQHFNTIESQQPRWQQEQGAIAELHDHHTENFHPIREKSPQLQKKVGPTRRLTLPPGIFNVMQSQNLVKSHGETNKAPKRLSVASYSPNVLKSKVTAFSSRPERGPVDNAVTYAYDARPERSLCRGYVTMQMTVKGKQVKVHIPKFPHDADSQPVLERARKKVAEDRLQQKMPQEIAQITPKEENTDD